MEPIEFWTGEVHEGAAQELIHQMPENSVHSVVTSPPTYNMRDYESDGQIGNEHTVEEYVDNLVSLFSEVKRVLRPNGNLWVSLGDKYKNKRKQFLPYRIAIEMQDRDDWIPRVDVVWRKKGGGKPESVQDRFAEQTQRLMHFSQEKEYYFDLHPVREPKKSQPEQFPFDSDMFEGKNPGNVFEFKTVDFPDAPIPVTPIRLVEKAVKTTVPKKVCSECGTPYTRQTDSKRLNYQQGKEPEYTNGAISGGTKSKYPNSIWKHVGWSSKCSCHARGDEGGIVLDPFMGSGTTAKVAEEYNRRYVGFEINEDYVHMSKRKIEPSRGMRAESALSSW